MDQIKLLVVDDSILFREVISRFIQQDKMIDIVGKAGDAYSARDLILQYEPDVMTLDLEMPRMDGCAFLKRLLPQYYIPTIVVSSSEERRAACKEAGAVEFLTKPKARTNKDMEVFATELCDTIHKIYGKNHPDAKFDRSVSFSSTPATELKPTYQSSAASALEAAAQAEKLISDKRSQFNQNIRSNDVVEPPAGAVSTKQHSKLKKTEAIIALGASTGGTEALEQVVKCFPADTPPVIIVQHMPAGFTKLFSERLDRSCKMHVKEAQDGDRLKRGLIIVGAGENHLRLCKDSNGFYVSSKPGEKVSGHCPSVDVMFESVANTAGNLAIGAILTGMGRDGADGLLKMRNAGAFTIGQDRESCVVYGMPMEAYKIGAVEVQAPLSKIADIILNDLI